MKRICYPLTSPAILTVLATVFILASPVNSSVSRTLDETPVAEDPTVKCTPCTQSPPPPPPPSPCPPPPSPPPPVVYLSPPPPEVYLLPPPPPAPKPPTTSNCPPPPSTPDYIYVIGPPGSVYPIDPNYSNSVLRRVVISFPVMVWSGLVVFLGFS